MRTIYEKEALFERLDAAVAELKEYIVGAVHRAELHQVEQQMFRQLQQVGRHGLETFVALSGTGYEAANPPLSEEGSPLEYKGAPRRRARPMCRFLEASRSIVPPMPIRLGGGSIPLMRS